MNYLTKLVYFLGLIGSLLVTGAMAFSLKRGLSYNDDIPLQGFGGNRTQITWRYNWGSTTINNKLPAVEYVPMLWSNYTDVEYSWPIEARSWMARGSTHLLAFNEPELSSQANLTPGQATELWHQLMEPFAGRAKLGAPAVSNDGWQWINAFLTQCENCTIDFVPVHWYNPWWQTADLENWVKIVCGLPGRRSVWVTEFGPSDAAKITPDQRQAFLTNTTRFLDNEPCVERYAYFGSADNDKTLLNIGGPGLSTLGNQYAFHTGDGVPAATRWVYKYRKA